MLQKIKLGHQKHELHDRVCFGFCRNLGMIYVDVLLSPDYCVQRTFSGCYMKICQLKCMSCTCLGAQVENIPTDIQGFMSRVTNETILFKFIMTAIKSPSKMSCVTGRIMFDRSNTIRLYCSHLLVHYHNIQTLLLILDNIKICHMLIQLLSKLRFPFI